MSSSIQTYNNKYFDIFNPDIGSINIEDIAHSLSNTCRFGGHTNQFYSVAEHSVYVSNLCQHQNKLWGLLHDAGEAYVGDIPTPIKRQFPLISQLEDKIMELVCEKFGLNKNKPKEIKENDTIMLVSERHSLLTVDEASNDYWAEHDGVVVLQLPRDYGWNPDKARHMFLMKFGNLYETV